MPLAMEIDSLPAKPPAPLGIEKKAEHQRFGLRARRRLMGRWRRLYRWEFWPPFLFYPPVIAYIIYLGIRFRSWTLFAAANPAIPASGFVGESKHQILDRLKNGLTVPCLPAS